MDFPITNDQIAEYEENGFICLRNVIPEHELDVIRSSIASATDEIYRSPMGLDLTQLVGQVWDKDEAGTEEESTKVNDQNNHQYRLNRLARLAQLSKATPLRDDAPDSGGQEGGGRFLLDSNLTRRYPDLFDFAATSQLPSVVGRLLRSAFSRFYFDQFFIKEPKSIER
ncbi:MAG: hypothetical protein AAGL49_10320, partial [Pseudomonadota bacterium]